MIGHRHDLVSLVVCIEQAGPVMLQVAGAPVIVPDTVVAILSASLGMSLASHCIFNVPDGAELGFLDHPVNGGVVVPAEERGACFQIAL